ncbi:hypothetical protein CTI12_AA570340 [Artemisia annua]|uniref:Uncharacterized protein n=1 Tax=Artemisia annua TaxID=35608 RepID=A0A2U1KS64_ARTAN|nr:hypothetical protein CTI12_AA570340 [Artemisia annua]
METSQYASWAELFKIHCRRAYDVIDHLTSNTPPPPKDNEPTMTPGTWSRLDALVVVVVATTTVEVVVMVTGGGGALITIQPHGLGPLAQLDPQAYLRLAHGRLCCDYSTFCGTASYAPTGIESAMHPIDLEPS